MSNKPNATPLEELLSQVIDRRGVTPIKLDGEFTEKGHRVISAKVLKDGRIDLKADEPRFVDDDIYRRWMKGPLLADDVIMTSEAPLGEVAYISEQRDWCLGQRLFGLRTRKDRMHGRFLYYALRSDDVRHDLLSRATGTTAQGIRQSELLQVLVPEPRLDEQLAIAHVLGTLDDQIELNLRMNDTLEAISRALFNSWFVNFDPVHAQARGEAVESICRDLGLTSDVLAFFPTRVIHTELGPTPEGWEVKPLSQITSYLSRGVSPKYVESGGVLVLNQKCIRDGRVDVSKGRRHDRAQRDLDGRTIELGDVLVNSTGVGTLGRVAQVLEVDEPTIVDSHVTVVRADPAHASWNYLGVAMQEREAEIEALGEGSTGQTELSRVRLGKLPMLVPPKPLREYFDEVVVPMRLRSKRNDEQRLTLGAIRDALLPRLLSGELRVAAGVVE